jgi:transposase
MEATDGHERKLINFLSSKVVRRALIRSILYMATLSAVYHNKPIKVFHQRLIADGKHKEVALVAYMRKLLIILNSMIKNNNEWNPNFSKLA